MNSTGYISYVYDALGTRHSKSYYLTGNGGSSGGQYSYIDDLVFHNGSLEHVRFDGGYISFASGGVPQYHYFHTDHLGSVRVVTDASGNVEQRRSYYPFGASFRENATTDGNRLKFSGKELERLHGLNDYDFGARTYVPTIGRFTQMDPLCEKYYHISPYAYCANDPITYIDEDGREKLNAINPSPSDIKQRESNANIIRAIRNFVDDDKVVNIWAHGSSSGITVYYSNTKREVDITSAKDFKRFLDTNSDVWKNKKAGENVTVVLHACKTGNSDEVMSFAQKLSKEIDGISIIAPDQDVIVVNGVETGTYQGDKVVLSEQWNADQPRSEGKWYRFENGNSTKYYKGRFLPGSKDFSMYQNPFGYWLNKLFQ